MFEGLHSIFAVKPENRKFLGRHIEYFVPWLRNRNYADATIHDNIDYIIYFFEPYLYKRGIRSIHQLEGIKGQKLLDAFKSYIKRRNYTRRRDCTIKFYLQALAEASVIKKLPPSKNIELFPWTQRYATFLKEQKGLRERTIERYTYWSEKFLSFIGCKKGSLSIPTFGIADVDRFIELEAPRYKKDEKKVIAVVLRGLLRLLYQSGKRPTDLSYLVLAPRTYTLASLPHVLSWKEVQKVLNKVDRSTKCGLRDYAILILVAMNGIRTGEVTHLKLEDIDWEKETMHITQRKCGDDLWLPLLPEVGKAILAYLERGRPPSKYREIFLYKNAPRIPLNRSGVNTAVNYHIRRAGINLPRAGPSIFRHTFATHLNNEGVPFKQIGDLLGHRNPKSVYWYTKTAIKRLSEVPLKVPKVK